MAAVIDPVTECRQVLAAMVDFEGKDSDAVAIEHHAFVDAVRFQLYAFGRIVMAAHADVDVERFRQVLHHLFGSVRSPNPQRGFSHAPGPADPTGEPEIDKADNVVRVMVREKNAGDVGEGNAQLM